MFEKKLFSVLRDEEDNTEYDDYDGILMLLLLIDLILY